MDRWRLLVVLRTVLLASLPVYFATALVWTLLRERPDLLRDQQQGFGQDPGVRVLLTDRERGQRERRDLTVGVLQPALLSCPDNPEAWRVTVAPDTTLGFKPDATTGGMLVVGLPQPPAWGGKALRLRLTPLDQTPTEAGPGGSGDIALAEAGNRQPLFVADGRRYRGSLEVVAHEGRWLWAINALPVEAWLDGVLQREMGPSWPVEALKAQAIVCRSAAFAARLTSRSRAAGLLRYDLTDADPDPGYDGTGHGGRVITWAIDETRGRILCHRNAPFTPYYHAASGGRTAPLAAIKPDAATVDGQPLDTVMPSLEDPWCAKGVAALGGEKVYGRILLRFDRGEVGRMLLAQGITQYWVIRDLAVERFPSGHVRNIILHTYRSGESVVLTAEDFRRLLGKDGPRSNLWSDDSPREIEARKDDQAGPNALAFEVETLGRGHGVGMSQVSAYAMAQEGWDAAAILRFFYPETEIRVRW